LLDATFRQQNGNLLFSAKDTIVPVHITPLCGSFELVALGWKAHFQHVRVLSCGTRAEDVQWARAKLGFDFLKDWRLAEHKYVPESNLKYDDNVEPAKVEELSVKQPELSLASWHADGKQVQLPVSVRTRWAADIIFQEDWTAALKAFDVEMSYTSDPVPVPLTGTSDPGSASGGSGSSDPVPPPLPEPVEWAAQPAADLREIVKEFPASADKDGNARPAVKLALTSSGADGAQYKLYAISTGDACTVPSGAMLFHFGACDWHRPPKGWTTLSNPQETRVVGFEIASDADQVVLEVVAPGARRPEDVVGCCAHAVFMRIICLH
jgi:hypothetical protein